MMKRFFNNLSVPIGMTRTIACLLLAVLVAAVSTADVINDSDEVVSLYARGKRLMREGDWLRASRLFEELAGRYPESKNLDLFVFHRAKADYYLGDFAEAAAGFGYLISHFPESPDLPYAQFFLANTHYHRGEVDQAVAGFFESFRLSGDSRLDRLVEASLEAALQNAASINLREVDFQGLPKGKRCQLVRLVADAILEKGDIGKAGNLLSLCGERVDPSVASKIEAERDHSSLEVAIVLPFSGELHTWAENIHNGAVIAAETFRRESGRELKLVTYDTKGDPIDAARIISELSRGYSAHVAVGPLTSEAAAVASASVSCGTLPLLIPAATQAGLTQLSTTVYQLSPNIELQGVRMAEYAIDSLGADSAAIVTSTSSDHLRTARAFSERFEKLGGTIMAIQYYRSRDKDFGPYIRDVKAMLLGKHPDSIFFLSEEGDTLDPDGIPVSVDCLFLPGNPQQLRLLLPQIRFYKLQGFYLGSDGWGDEAVYGLGEDITRGAVFPSPFLAGGTSDTYLEFAAAFDARFGRQPNRLSRLGYDAVRLATMAATASRCSRENIVSRLKQIRDYEGASGKITFGKHRENTEMPLYRIESKQPVPLAARKQTVEEPSENE